MAIAALNTSPSAALLSRSIGDFGGLEAQVTLSFLLVYNMPQAMMNLTYGQFLVFMQGRRYPRRALPKQYAIVQQPYPEASLETVTVYAEKTTYLARQLLELVRRKRALKRELSKQSQQHLDAPIFASLSGAGELLAPSLLAKFGDDQRFATREKLVAYAGIDPVVYQTGEFRAASTRTSKRGSPCAIPSGRLLSTPLALTPSFATTNDVN